MVLEVAKNERASERKYPAAAAPNRAFPKGGGERSNWDRPRIGRTDVNFRIRTGEERKKLPAKSREVGDTAKQ